MATTKTNPVKDAIVAHKLIHKQDFRLLRAQKTILIDMTGKKKLSNTEVSAIEGMLCLLDAIQDLAVDQYGYEQKELLNLPDEETGKFPLTIRQASKIVNE